MCEGIVIGPVFRSSEYAERGQTFFGANRQILTNVVQDVRMGVVDGRRHVALARWCSRLLRKVQIEQVLCGTVVITGERFSLPQRYGC